MEGFSASDNNDPKSASIVDTMKFVMPATLEYGSISALRVQDILVYDIVRTTNWQRPIYFAITAGGDDSKIGLRDYLELQGLAYKLVPQRKQAYNAINEEITRAHLFTDVKVPSKEPAYGCLWRGLQDSTIHFDENLRHMIASYRQPFYMLVMYLANVKNKPQEISAVLDRMEQVIPRRIHPIDYRLKTDIASFYNMSGNTQRYRECPLRNCPGPDSSGRSRIERGSDPVPPVFPSCSGVRRSGRVRQSYGSIPAHRAELLDDTGGEGVRGGEENTTPKREEEQNATRRHCPSKASDSKVALAVRTGCKKAQRFLGFFVDRASEGGAALAMGTKWLNPLPAKALCYGS